MTQKLFSRLRRHMAQEQGSMTVEFAIWFPLFMVILLASVELGVVTVRHTMLERSLDMTVRDIRLGTGTAPQHDQIKDQICENIALVPDCQENLRLEMMQRDLRAWTSIDGNADCTDQSAPVAPVRQFSNGLDNELMVLRACLKFTPFFPTTALGESMAKDANGDVGLIATSAFVQEPR
ncbi:TadE/TadG family type IV pilus assembly protein [Pseudaestuariivita atlantica]|uniref:Pilus assembly protein TadE n=1 Tax=Pseudaestuariivita atlantica TaxID=1317121 RepID=A0A0L1JLM8_9RHOB|nr:TadE family protein [Pseudaestuariivita atlantica]KNG92655.1 pilus assembly protein TadE [Pseudaestuariivita atlantica]